MRDLRPEDHGRRFRATIYDDRCEGKIAHRSDGKYFLCQNVSDGAGHDEKFGYKYSWIVNYGTVRNLTSEGVENFEFLDEPTPAATESWCDKPKEKSVPKPEPKAKVFKTKAKPMLSCSLICK